jgi:uncharacterized membrane protein
MRPGRIRILLVVLAAALSAACATQDGRALPAEAAATLRAHGHEPSWTLTLGSKLRFDSGRLHIEGPGRPLEIRDGVWRHAAALRDRAIAVDVEVLTAKETCLDRVSGRAYPLRVDVLIDGRRYRGCGSASAAPLPGGE